MNDNDNNDLRLFYFFGHLKSNIIQLVIDVKYQVLVVQLNDSPLCSCLVSLIPKSLKFR